MVARTRPASEHKRHGKHQKTTKQFLKVYWPYLPLVVIAGFISLNLFWQPAVHHGTLAFATNVSRSQLLSATNAARRQQVSPILTENTLLDQAAQAKANDMSARDYWSHATPDGRAPWTFIEQTGYSYQKAGENLAYGFNTSNETVTAWLNSPEHRANLLDGDYHDVGFGFANANNYQHGGSATIVVALYGTTMPVTHGTKGINSLRPVAAEPAAQRITLAQLLTKGHAPWVSYALGLVSGGLAAWLVIKHALGFRRLFRQGERFITAHPLLDIYLVASLALCLTLTRSAGLIR